jgi:hypothetical protein
MTPTSSRRRPKPVEIEIEPEKDNREGMTLMRPVEGEITLDSSTRFAVVPGPKGKGWVLRVLPDPE